MENEDNYINQWYGQFIYASIYFRKAEVLQSVISSLFVYKYVAVDRNYEEHIDKCE